MTTPKRSPDFYLENKYKNGDYEFTPMDRMRIRDQFNRDLSEEADDALEEAVLALKLRGMHELWMSAVVLQWAKAHGKM